MSKRIAILVLGCVSPPYDRTIDAIRRTWGAQRVPGLDILYLYGRPHNEAGRRVLAGYLGRSVPRVEGDGICHTQDVLIAGCADDISQQQDCLLRKRLTAFAYLSAGDRYDLIYTVCATSYVDQPELARYADSLISRRLIAGSIGVDASSTAPFVSGASMILSVEIARELGACRKQIVEENVFGHYDDVTMGHWVATRMSRVPVARFIEDVRQQRPMTSEHIFVSCPHGTVDYVMTPTERHRPVRHAFHYHFHSQRARDIMRFHRRYDASSAANRVKGDG